MVQLCKGNGLGAEALYYIRLAGEFRAQCLDGHLALQHQVHTFVDRTHTAFADLFGYLIGSYYITYHESSPGVLISRVARTASCWGSFPDSGAAFTSRSATVMLSYPPRCLARSMRLPQAPCGSSAITASIISRSSTRS